MLFMEKFTLLAKKITPVLYRIMTKFVKHFPHAFIC